MMRTNLLTWGEPAPWFTASCTSSPRFNFDSLAGRWVVLCFYESGARPDSHRIIQDFAKVPDFDGIRATFSGVSVDPEDERHQRVPRRDVGFRHFWDFDRSVSQQFGATGPSPGAEYRRHTLLLDERLRVVAVVPFDDSPQSHVARVVELMAGRAAFAAVDPPVLVVPRLFEPKLCQVLMQYYDKRGGEESGFMREVDGRTVYASDHAFKRRRDEEITDEVLRKACMVRIHDRLAPEIHKAFQFRPTRIERYIVACYDATSGGFFKPHRDNTTLGTAHRRFAVSLNLNTGQYEGGNLRFPEFGPQEYVPPAGGAVVFSCSLLHEATPVTQGKRYVFLPFLYDEEAARIREQNLAFVAPPPVRQEKPQS